MSEYDGGPAFPLATGSVETTGDRGQKIVTVRELQRGLSLRDYFAAHAPTPQDWYILESLPRLNNMRSLNDSVAIRKSAELAWPYVWADAMLAERAKRNVAATVTVAQCKQCGRLEYDVTKVGESCQMLQPNGSRCLGVLR